MKTRNLKIRTVIPVLAIVAVCMLFAAAASGCRKSNKPKEVVVKFFEHLYDGDYGSAMPYCTDRCMRQVLDDGGLAFNKVRDDHDSGGNIYTESKLVSHVKGENTCEIYSEEDEELRIWLVRENGIWMIDEFEYREEDRDRDRDRDRDEDERDEDEDEDGRDRGGLGRDRD